MTLADCQLASVVRHRLLDGASADLLFCFSPYRASLLMLNPRDKQSHQLSLLCDLGRARGAVWRCYAGVPGQGVLPV